MIPYDPRRKKKNGVEVVKTNVPCSFCNKIIPTIGELLEHEENHEKQIEEQAKKRPNIPYSQFAEEASKENEE